MGAEVSPVTPGTPPPMPSGGVFGVSEVVPIITATHAEAEQLRVEWGRLRTAADEAKAEAKRVRANLIVALRVFGNDGTDGVPIKTSAERNEWADADPSVQAAELAADLAATTAANGREAYQLARSRFDMLRTALGMERDSFGAERSGR